MMAASWTVSWWTPTPSITATGTQNCRLRVNEAGRNSGRRGAALRNRGKTSERLNRRLMRLRNPRRRRRAFACRTFGRKRCGDAGVREIRPRAGAPHGMGGRLVKPGEPERLLALEGGKVSPRVLLPRHGPFPRSAWRAGIVGASPLGHAGERSRAGRPEPAARMQTGRHRMDSRPAETCPAEAVDRRPDGPGVSGSIPPTRRPRNI